MKKVVVGVFVRFFVRRFTTVMQAKLEGNTDANLYKLKISMKKP
jgi:hypothetical protein